MPDLNTSFHRRVTKLKAPTSTQFNASEWEALLDADSSPSDQRLIAGAMLIAAEMQALRGGPADAERDALDAATETCLCVAAMNVEYFTIIDLSLKASRQAVSAGALSYGHITGAQFETGQGHHGKNINNNNYLKHWFDSGFFGTIGAMYWKYEQKPTAAFRFAGIFAGIVEPNGSG